MKIGICLTGGGAKGAFEAGVIESLTEGKIYPSILSGTSIGAINGYYIMKGNYDALKNMWLNIDDSSFEIVPGIVMDNTNLIDLLKDIEDKGSTVDKFYVNYVSVKGSTISEINVDIKGLSEAEALKCIKWSSLLPARIDKNEEVENLRKNFDSGILFEKFKEDLKNGVYDGFNLDGGILNNNFLEPFLKNDVDILIAIGLKNDYMIPDYIFDKYDRNAVFVVKPRVLIRPEDTIKFKRDYTSCLYKDGLEMGLELLNKIKILFKI